MSPGALAPVAGCAVVRRFDAIVGAGLARPRTGDGVVDVWRRMVRQPDRFICVDSTVFCEAAVSGAAYAARYGHS